MWLTYIETVDILVDFSTGERDSNWTLHVEAFAAMLCGFTVYYHTYYTLYGHDYLADMTLLEKKAPEVHPEFTGGNFVVN